MMIDTGISFYFLDVVLNFRAATINAKPMNIFIIA
jgi:hypothetical protein